MNIGSAAAASGVTAKMIRHYESIGLIQPSRLRNSYRQYTETEVHELRFIGRARSLGFSMKEIEMLLSLWRDRRRPSREVRKIADKHLADLDQRIREMKAMAETLRQLVSSCSGSVRPDCPILDELAASRR